MKNAKCKSEIKKEAKRRFGLTISLVFFVFAVLIIGGLLAGSLVAILHFTGVLHLGDNNTDYTFAPFRAIFSMMIFSTFLGTALTAFFSKKALNPIRKVIKATKKISEGDFNVRVDIGGIYELEELESSFNKMAQELSSIETLRSDFINTFSHEFKTPIVSLRGFAKLLKDNNLPETERQEYLDIIITESERLANLSTNVLNLSKYENIEIITDKSSFRLDEQIRRAVVMTEPKWSAKKINLDVEMVEIVYKGNEDLTQHIWLNLLDNAVKFTEQGGNIKIRLEKWNNGVRFKIQDDGNGFDDDIKEKIFDKFYQSDSSRTKAGNGLGLAIVKKIVELHGGSVKVKSEQDKGSTFTVFLPLNNDKTEA